MDPHSVASAAATLLGLSIQIAGALYGDWEDSSAAPAERLTYELARLRAVLQSLEETSLTLNSPVILYDLPDVLEEVRHVLVSLGAELLGYDPSRDSLTVRNVQWEWRSFGVQRDGKKLALSRHDAERKVKDIQVSITKLKMSLSQNPDLQIGHGIRKNISIPAQSNNALWREKADYSSAHITSKSQRVEGTGLWLVRHPTFRKWILGERSGSALYCAGGPGSGKTILASLVIDEIEMRRTDPIASNIGLAYFYFSYKVSTPIRNVALALLEQFYLQSSTLATETKDLEKRAAASESISLVEIMAALFSVAGRFRKAYIVIDALDECAADHRQDVLRLLSGINDSQYHLFITSRPTTDIDTLLITYKIEVTLSKTDIELFVEDKLSEPSDVIDEALQTQIVSTLSKAGSKHGMFLLVALQLQAILTSESRKETTAMLSSLQGGLESMYNDQIDRIRTQTTQRSALAMRTLSWLYYATRPLLANELQQILDFESELSPSLHTNDSALDVCMGLVVKAETTNVVSFMHFSVHEFLAIQQHSHKSPPAREITIARICLLFLFQNDLAQSVRNLAEVVSRSQNFPFYTYAAKFWGIHFQRAHTAELKLLDDNSTSQSELVDLALKFLRDIPRVNAAIQIVFSSKGAEMLSHRGPIESTALHLVAHFGLAWAVNGLLSDSPQHGKPLSQDSWGRTPLHIAAAGGFDVCVSRLLLNLEDVDHDILRQDENGRTVWHHAAIGGSLEVANVLQSERNVGKGPRIMLPDGVGKTPLDYASHYGFTEFVKFLLESDLGDFDHIDLSDMDDALTAALNSGQSGVIDVLLRHGVPPADKFLLAAVRSGLESSVRILLEYGAHIDAASSSGETALHVASISGKSSILSFLISNGANLEAEDVSGRTPLASAVEKGDLEAVRVLLHSGADGEAIVKDGQSLITYAASQGMVELLPLLLEAGVDPAPAAFTAIKNGQVEATKMLVHKAMSEFHSTFSQREYLDKLSKQASTEGLTELRRFLQHYEFRPIKAMHSRLGTAGFSTMSSVDAGPDNSEMVMVPKVPGEEVVPMSSDMELVPQKGELGTLQLDSTDDETVQHPIRQRSSDAKQPVKRPDRVWSAGSGPSKSTSKSIGKPAFLVLPEPLPVPKLRLGVLVKDPKRPLLAYLNPQLDVHGALIDEHTLSQKLGDYAYHQSTSKSRAFTGFGTASNESEVALSIRAPEVTRLTLSNAAEVIDHMLVSSDTLERWNRFFGSRKEIYMVVGLMILSGGQVQSKRQQGRGASLSIGFTGASFGLPISAGNAIEHQNQDQEWSQISYKGDVIFAVQYRRLSGGRPSHFSRIMGAQNQPIKLKGYWEMGAHERVL